MEYCTEQSTANNFTGGVKSTPINAMEMFSGIEPIQIACEEAALKLFERIKRTPNSLWKTFPIVENRLRSYTPVYLRKIWTGISDKNDKIWKKNFEEIH